MTKDEMDAVIATLEAAVDFFPRDTREATSWNYEDDEDVEYSVNLRARIEGVIGLLREDCDRFQAWQNALNSVMAVAREVCEYRWFAEDYAVLQSLRNAIWELDALEATFVNTSVTCDVFPCDVFPEVLKWARETSGVSLNEAARHVGVAAEMLEAWEATKTELLIGQIRALAKLYGRPLAALLLPEPLNESVPKPGDVVAVRAYIGSVLTIQGVTTFEPHILFDQAAEYAPWCSAEEQAALRKVADAAMELMGTGALDEAGDLWQALEKLRETSE